MQFVVPHEVTYDFDGRASVGEVAKSLVAQDKLFREAVRVLEACFPDLEVESVTINVRLVVQQSPLRHRLEGFIIAALSPRLTEDVPADILQTLFGYDVPDSYDSIITILIALIGMWGAERLIRKIKRAKKDADRRRTEDEERFLAAERRRLTQEAAERARVTEGQMTEALSATLSQREASVIKSSMDFLAPARRHGARAILLPGGRKISGDAIRAVPSDVDLAQYQPPTETYPLEGVPVIFRAHDRDRAKHWAATIPEVSPHRKPLHLAPDIRSDALFTRDRVIADVLVTQVLDPEGDYQPSLYYLTKVHE